MTARAAAALLVLGCIACDARARPVWDRGEQSRPPKAGDVAPPLVRTTTFEAGPPGAQASFRNPYAGEVQEGERFYTAFNCGGCHGERGGGGIGPPFAVPQFIYGSAPQNIHQSIVQGRPNGMPAFGGRVPDDVVWKITAYVQSLAAPHQPEGSEMNEGSDPSHGRGGG